MGTCGLRDEENLPPMDADGRRWGGFDCGLMGEENWPPMDADGEDGGIVGLGMKRIGRRWTLMGRMGGLWA